MSIKFEGEPPFYLGVAETAAAQVLDTNVIVRVTVLPLILQSMVSPKVDGMFRANMAQPPFFAVPWPSARPLHHFVTDGHQFDMLRR